MNGPPAQTLAPPCSLRTVGLPVIWQVGFCLAQNLQNGLAVGFGKMCEIGTLIGTTEYIPKSPQDIGADFVGERIERRRINQIIFIDRGAEGNEILKCLSSQRCPYNHP